MKGFVEFSKKRKKKEATQLRTGGFIFLTSMDRGDQSVMDQAAVGLIEC